MATFSKSSFSYSSYAKFRPVYPSTLYDTILNHHKGPRDHCIDLGCGPGIVTRAIAQHFTMVTGVDPSHGMIEQAKSLTPSTEYPNIDYQVTAAESLSFLAAANADMVVAGQAAHWFDYPKLWPELQRVVRHGGTVAFWGYGDCVFPDYPSASKLLRRYAGERNPELMGNYWSNPGRNIVENLYRDIVPPDADWEATQRLEYHPGFSGPGSGRGTLFLQKRMKAADIGNYLRTWSAYHGWKEAHPTAEKRVDGRGVGDVIDHFLDEVKMLEEDWRNEDSSIVVEWATGILVTRRK